RSPRRGREVGPVAAGSCPLRTVAARDTGEAKMAAIAVARRQRTRRIVLACMQAHDAGPFLAKGHLNPSLRNSFAIPCRVPRWRGLPPTRVGKILREGFVRTPMRRRPLGKPGLQVAEIGFGAWAIGGTARGNSY